MFCSNLPRFAEYIRAYFYAPTLSQKSVMWQIDAVGSSKNVVEIESSYYRSISRLFYHKNVNFSSPMFQTEKRPAEAERPSCVLIKLLGTSFEKQVSSDT